MKVPVDTLSLTHAMGDASPEWYGEAFQRAYYRTLRGGVATVEMLDRIAVTLGCHYTQLLGAAMNDLSTKPVRIDTEALTRLAQDYLAEHTSDHPMKSPLSPLVCDASLSLAQLEGRKTAPLWQVESLAVLLRCEPHELIVTTSVPAEPTQPKEAPMRGTAWTSEEEQTLRDNAWQGSAKCCEILGKSNSAVAQKAAKLGISLRKREPVSNVVPMKPKAKDCKSCAHNEKPWGEEPCETQCTDYSAWTDEKPAEQPEPIEQADDSFEIPTCRICGCTDDEACEDGCFWVEDPAGKGHLCSTCLPQAKAELIADTVPSDEPCDVAKEAFEPDCNVTERVKAYDPKWPLESLDDALPKPSVTVNVTGLKSVISKIKQRDELIDILCEHIIHVEAQRSFVSHLKHPAPYDLSGDPIEAVRKFAEQVQAARARARFMERMEALYDSIAEGKDLS